MGSQSLNPWSCHRRGENSGSLTLETSFEDLGTRPYMGLTSKIMLCVSYSGCVYRPDAVERILDDWGDGADGADTAGPIEQKVEQ